MQLKRLFNILILGAFVLVGCSDDSGTRQEASIARDGNVDGGGNGSGDRQTDGNADGDGGAKGDADGGAKGDADGASVPAVVWKEETLELTEGRCANAIALGVDGHGVIHLAYSEPLFEGERSGGLRYARNVDGTWEQDMNLPTVGRTIGLSLRLGSSGDAHLLWGALSTYPPIYYGSNTAGDWSVLQIVPGNVPGYSAQMALDRSETPHVSRIVKGLGDDITGVVHETPADEPDPLPWMGEPVEQTEHASVDTMTMTSIEFTPTGELSVAYFIRRSDVAELRYATEAGGAWTPQTAARFGTATVSVVGHAPSDGGPTRIVVVDNGTGALHLASQTPDAWTVEPIPASQDPGNHAWNLGTSMGVDEAGALQLVVVNAMEGTLVHLWQVSGGWASAVRASAPDMLAADIAFGPDGRTHIVWCTGQRLAHMYESE